MCEAHENNIRKGLRWPFVRSKIEMSKSKMVKHFPVTFALKILGDPKGCSRDPLHICILATSMLNLEIISQTILNILEIHFSYDIKL